MITDKEVGHLITFAEMTKAIEAVGDAFTAATQSLDSAVETKAVEAEPGDDPLALEPGSPLES